MHVFTYACMQAWRNLNQILKDNSKNFNGAYNDIYFKKMKKKTASHTI